MGASAVPMDIWSTVLQALRKKLSSREYHDWLKPTYQISQDKQAVKVRVPNEKTAEHIRTQYLSLIREVFAKNGMEDVEMHFATEGPKQLTLSGDDKDEHGSSHQHHPAAQLNPRYSFQNFVVGPFNEFAHASALAVADSPRTTRYNPLFIYGGTGLGKTHLMHAIGIEVGRRFPELKQIYITTEEFTNEFIKALRLGKTQEFKDKYRNVDLLLIDDIHLLAGKASTQEEFFHTFNALYEHQRQIVMASDLLPREIQGLRERLHSRFQGGLIADIKPPDVESKVAILHQKAQMENTVIPDDVAWFVASRVKSNIRNLEGCLVRMLAMASIYGSTINIGLAKEVLKPLINTEDRIVTPALIQETVAQYYQLKVEDLKSRNHSKMVVTPRQIAMYLCKQLTNCSLPEIGRCFGNKHHSTVIHSINKIGETIKHDPILQNEVNTLTETIKTT
jgi:chromosomal replication initiator protein